MFNLGTSLGIGVSIIIFLGLLATVRWQLRLGDFWLYSVLFLLLLTPVVLSTYVGYSMLSPESLAAKTAEQPELTSEQVLARAMASANSIILMISGFCGLLSLLLSALTFAKAKRLEKLAGQPETLR